MDGGGGYEDTGDDYEHPESKVIDIYYHPVKEEPEPELGGGDKDAVDVNGYCDYGPFKEKREPELDRGSADVGDDEEGPESKVVDVFYYARKEELSSDDGDAVDGPHEREPEPKLPATGGDPVGGGGRDVAYNCCHCRVNLSSEKFKLEHELRCKIRTKRREVESQVTDVYHCRYCRCPFVSKKYKEQHQRKWCRKKPVATRKDSNGADFQCDKCGYVAKLKDSMDRHLLNHNKNDAEWFTCMQCSYKTVHKRDMTEHMKKHSNTFTYCCPICGKSFKLKSYLDDHLVKLHTDKLNEVSKLITNKIYTCNICDKYRTVSKTRFNEHLNITHLKGDGCQKYQCPRCSYSTFCKGNLKKHSNRHLGQKNYRCTDCKKQFTQKQGLDSHILSFHADKDLVKTITSKIHCCTLCSFKAVMVANLKSHIRSIHLN